MGARDFSVVLSPTLECNAACDYCFQAHEPKRTDVRLLGEVFAKLRAYSVDRRLARMRIYWQGGEILTLPPGLLEQVLRTEYSCFEGSGVEIDNHLQTNLIAYSSAYRDLITSHFRGEISSSIDYPNLYRHRPGQSAEAFTEEWLRKKDQAEADGLRVAVIAMPNAETLELGAEAFVRHFVEDLGIRNFQVNFPFPGAGPRPLQIDTDRLAAFYADLFDVTEAYPDDLSVNPFALLKNTLHSGDKGLPCLWSTNCAEGLCGIGPDGMVAACDCWLTGTGDHTFGSLAELDMHEVMDSPRRARFGERSKYLLSHTDCGLCRYWALCHGGCPVRAFAFTGSLHEKDHYCTVYKRIFEKVGDRSHA
jgi:radical SAM protein with 4Fe4S-binding SPASM domain